MRCCEIVAICFCEISTKWYCGFARLVQDGAARSVRDGPCEAVKRGRYEIVLRDHETGLLLCEPACCLQPVGRGSSRRSKRTNFFSIAAAAAVSLVKKGVWGQWLRGRSR